MSYRILLLEQYNEPVLNVQSCFKIESQTGSITWETFIKINGTGEYPSLEDDSLSQEELEQANAGIWYPWSSWVPCYGTQSLTFFLHHNFSII